MNREIKFRAWDKEKKIMRKPFKIETGGWEEFDLTGELELMQYTSLKDRKGVEIFEGDIVRNYSGWLLIIENDGFHWLETLIGERNNEDGRTIVIEQRDVKTWEVIGNIYKNPEFIK